MARKPKLTIPTAIWEKLLHELHQRTEELHESGAFLLGHASGPGRHVSDTIFYDDLDPDVYRTGVVVMHSPSFGALWDRCRSLGLSVVADIHVHPKAAFQSWDDKNHPMIATAGHLALIVPDFARPPVVPEKLGFFEYRGSHRWRSIGGSKIRRFLRIGGPGEHA